MMPVLMIFVYGAWGRLRLEWFDYLLVPNIVVLGLLNALILNNKY